MTNVKAHLIYLLFTALNTRNASITTLYESIFTVNIFTYNNTTVVFTTIFYK